MTEYEKIQFRGSWYFVRELEPNEIGQYFQHHYVAVLFETMRDLRGWESLSVYDRSRPNGLLVHEKGDVIGSPSGYWANLGNLITGTVTNERL